MLREAYEALEFLGTRVVWDALAAIGSLAAFGAAIRLADRQSRDQRRRDAARVKGVMAIILPAVEAIGPALQANEALQRDFARFLVARRTGDAGAEADAHAAADGTREAASKRAADLARLVRLSEKRLRQVDPFSLPSTATIASVERALAAFNDGFDAIRTLGTSRPDREGIERLQTQLNFVVKSLGEDAQRFGGFAERHDVKALHSLLGAAVLKARRANRSERRYKALLRRQRTELDARQREFEARRKDIAELERRVIQNSVRRPRRD